jgi:hypothetical protein
MARPLYAAVLLPTIQFDYQYIQARVREMIRIKRRGPDLRDRIFDLLTSDYWRWREMNPQTGAVQVEDINNLDERLDRALRFYRLFPSAQSSASRSTTV